MKKEEIASMIDHTILKASALTKDVEKLCAEAKEFSFASVCVNPVFVPVAAKELKDSKVKVCTVVGFPLGANSSEIKKAETLWSVENGAEEIDMVIAVGKLKEGDDAYVEEDIRSVVEAAGSCCVKVILETCFLEKDEIIRACRLSEKAGAKYVKTSTGFGSGGAAKEDVQLMHETVPAMKVKASGGIRDLQSAVEMIKAGASRLGTSSGIKILEEM